MIYKVCRKLSPAIYHALFIACALNPHVCMGDWEVGVQRRLFECEAGFAESFDRDHPDEQLKRVTLAVSAMNRGVKRLEVDHLRIEISAKDAQWKAVELSPGTMIVDAGGKESKQQTEKKEDKLSTAVALGPGYKVRRIEKNEKIETLKIDKPLLRMVKVTSGVLGNGNKAWWKIFPADQDTVEGTYELTLLFRVPKCWRGDVADVAITVLNIKNNVICVHSQRIGLYVLGDGEVKRNLNDYLSCYDRKEDLNGKLQDNSISTNRYNELLRMYETQIKRGKKCWIS